MGKFILLLLLGFAAYLVFRGLRRPTQTRPRNAAAAKGERMVNCAYCGVHLPVSDGIESQGRHYCNEEHRRLGG